MEILELIRSSGRRAVLLLVFPVLTAALAGYVQVSAPVRYSSTATVNAPPSATARTGAQYVHDYQAAVASQVVAEKTAATTQVSVGSVRKGLDSSPTAEGSTLVEVTWTGTNKAAAADIPVVAARNAFHELVDQHVAALKAQAEQAQKRQADATKARDKYTDEVGVTLPPQALKVAQKTETQAKNRYDQAVVAGKDDNASQWKSRYESAKKQREKLEGTVRRYNELQTDVDKYTNALSQVRKDLDSAAAQLTSIDAPGQVQPGAVRALDRTRPLARAVAGGAVVGLLVALLLIGGTTAMRGGRRAPAPPSATGRRRGRDAEDVVQPDALLAPAPRGPAGERGLTERAAADRGRGEYARGRGDAGEYGREEYRREEYRRDEYGRDGGYGRDNGRENGRESGRDHGADRGRDQARDDFGREEYGRDRASYGPEFGREDVARNRGDVGGDRPVADAPVAEYRSPVYGPAATSPQGAPDRVSAGRAEPDPWPLLGEPDGGDYRRGRS